MTKLHTFAMDELQNEKTLLEQKIEKTTKDIKSVKSKRDELKEKLGLNPTQEKTQLELDAKQASKHTWIYGILTTVVIALGLGFLPIYHPIAYALLGTSILPCAKTLYHANHGYKIMERIKSIIETTYCLSILEEALRNHENTLQNEQNELQEIKTTLSALQKQASIQSVIRNAKSITPCPTVPPATTDQKEEQITA